MEANWDSDWERSILQTALERTKLRVNQGHYQIYDLCVHEGMSAPAVAHALEINVARVYLARHRVKQVVKAELEKLRGEIERWEAKALAGSSGVGKRSAS